jgi:bifunctional DNase/RNase
MKTDPIPIVIKGVMPAANGCAVFLGNESKTFVIHIDATIAEALKMTLAGEKKERPLTHDLFSNLLTGLGAEVAHVLINKADQGVFFARLVVQMKNELGQKIVELDARPSDSLLIAIKRRRPLYVAADLFETVEDMTELLQHLKTVEDADDKDEP